MLSSTWLSPVFLLVVAPVAGFIAVYFQFGTLLQCGWVSPAKRHFPDAHTLSWGYAMPNQASYKTERLRKCDAWMTVTAILASKNPDRFRGSPSGRSSAAGRLENGWTPR